MLVDLCSGGVLRISVSSVRVRLRHVTDHSQGMISVTVAERSMVHFKEMIYNI